jgi:hypothetical protein
VLQRGYPELVSTAAVGARLPYGLRLHVELDVTWETRLGGDVSATLRPAFRYWPSEAIGLGLSADLALLGNEGIRSSAIRFDLTFHALE